MWYYLYVPDLIKSIGITLGYKVIYFQKFFQKNEHSS